eukprot:359740-Chlamydomonas_euryale.AAC.4
MQVATYRVAESIPCKQQCLMQLAAPDAPSIVPCAWQHPHAPGNIPMRLATSPCAWQHSHAPGNIPMQLATLHATHKRPCHPPRPARLAVHASRRMRRWLGEDTSLHEDICTALPHWHPMPLQPRPSSSHLPAPHLPAAHPPPFPRFGRRTRTPSSRLASAGSAARCTRVAGRARCGTRRFRSMS